MDKSKEISDLLDYGIDISIEDCNVEDFLWGCFSDKEGLGFKPEPGTIL